MSRFACPRLVRAQHNIPRHTKRARTCTHTTHTTLARTPLQGVSFGAQANAMLRKSAVYQRRNGCTNCCLVATPIGFCVMLFAIQTVINRAIFGQLQYKVCLSGWLNMGEPGRAGEGGTSLHVGLWGPCQRHASRASRVTQLS